MPLLDVVQNVCDEVGLPRPAAVAASSDQLARQMLALANASLKSISREFTWPELQREHSFPTVIAQAAYALPANYRKLISHTVFDATKFYQMKGSVSPQEWQYTKSLNLGTLSRAKLRIYGNPLQIVILPTPAAVETVVFEYTTKNFAKDQANVEQLQYTVDTDTSIVNEDLIRMDLKWRIKHAKGLEFSADLAEAQAAMRSEFSKSMAFPAIQVGGRTIDEYPELTDGYTRDTGFGS